MEPANVLNDDDYALFKKVRKHISNLDWVMNLHDF